MLARLIDSLNKLTIELMRSDIVQPDRQTETDRHSSKFALEYRDFKETDSQNRATVVLSL